VPGGYACGMRKLFPLVFLLALPAAATDVYRWVDAAGQAHYSDQWQPGAEKIRIEESSRYAAPAPASKPAPAAAAAKGGQKAAVPRYESLEIASPAQEEVLWNVGGQVHVSMRVSPELRPGHFLRLLVDGTARDLPEGATDLQLQDVFRGVHTLKAQVVDGNGTVLASSEPTTFMVQQTSIAAPGGGS